MLVKTEGGVIVKDSSFLAVLKVLIGVTVLAAVFGGLVRLVGPVVGITWGVGFLAAIAFVLVEERVI